VATPGGAGSRARPEMVEIVRIDRDYLADARALLEEAARMEFENVIVLGFKDGKMHIQASAHPDTLRLMGALEAAKLEMWCGGG